MSKDNTSQNADGSTKPQRKRAKPAMPAVEDHKNIPTHFAVTPREYDVDLVEDFLNRVFHVELTDSEHVLTWAVPRHSKPVYPIAEDKLLDMIERTKVGKALYFGTATARPDHVGDLYNRQSLFERLHVIVLDDIGTKAAAEDLPEAMQNPSYIMETSEGNYQYGYVLEEPIDSVDAARALVMLMYEAGIADAGGKMPNKLVRLPEGINGKKDAGKCDFVTRLETMDGPNWTPQGLLDALNVGTKWEEVMADATEATKRRMRVKGGSTPWAPYAPAMASMSGIIDPVLEWLNETDQIVTEGGEWVTILCPFKQFHSSGGDTAGYKPLGAGEDPNQRVFHCFHDGCKDMKTREFLQYVGLNEGPSVSARDDVAELVADYIFDMSSDCAWKIRNVPAPKPVTMAAMQHTFPRATIVYDGEGKQKSISQYKRWLVSESRVTVMGPTFDPANPARIVDRDGDLFVNQFAPPEWGNGPYDEAHVKKFTDFVEYLIPDGYEREYFLDWLAAKSQNMGFRGAAIVMVAQRQGIGRSTLMDMVRKMLGEVNVRQEPFQRLVGDDAFNEWVEAPLVVTDETLNTSNLNQFKTYEKLKDIIDPRPKMVTVNPKYGKQRRSLVHSSFVFLSNHSNALAMTADDRRFFVISNPMVPADPSYFVELNAWLETSDWARHIYRWLSERKVNMEKLLAPPEMTTGKESMVDESVSEIEIVAVAIMAAWPCEYISQKQFKHVFEIYADRINLYDRPKYDAQIKRTFNAMTYAVDKGSLVRLNNKPARVRVIAHRADEDTVPKGGKLSDEMRRRVAIKLSDDAIRKAVDNVAERLDEVGL